MSHQHLAELGYACGLATMREALLCAQLHWDAYPAEWWRQLHVELATGVVALNMLCTEYLGAARCARIDADMDAYFAAHPASEPFEITADEFSVARDVAQESK